MAPGGSLANHGIAAPAAEFIVIEPAPGDFPAFLIEPAVPLQVLRDVGLTTRGVTAEDRCSHVARHAVQLGIVSNRGRVQVFGRRRHRLDRVDVPVAGRHEVVEVRLSNLGGATAFEVVGRQDGELLILGFEVRAFVRPCALSASFFEQGRDFLIVGQKIEHVGRRILLQHLAQAARQHRVFYAEFLEFLHINHGIA